METTTAETMMGEMGHENRGDEDGVVVVRGNSLFDGIEVNVKVLEIVSNISCWVACMWPACARQETKHVNSVHLA